MSIQKNLLLACASAIAVSGWAGAAAAQSEIEEVVVTARRVQESLQDVPIAVTALSSAQMRLDSVRNIRDLQSQAPSLYITSGSGGPSAAGVAIRGQTQADTLLVTDPSVAVYIDGINYPRQIGLRSSMFDIDQIQVLKGSQGTLFGKNTTGGALLFNTRAPSTNDFGGYGQLTLGNLNYVQVSAAANYPVIPDVLGVRLAVQKTKRDGLDEDALGTDVANINDESVRLGLLYTPNENVSLRLSADNTRTRQGGSMIRVTHINPFGSPLGAAANNALSAIATELGLSPNNTTANRLTAYNAFVAAATRGGQYDYQGRYAASSKLDLAGVMADLSIDFSGLTFRSITGNRWINRDDPQDYSASPFLLIVPENYQENRSFSQEVQLLNDPTERFSWIVGGYYSHEKGHEGGFSYNLLAINPNVNVQEWYVTNKSIAAFAQANYELTDTVRLTGGIRYSKVTQDYNGRTRNERPLGTFLACGIPTSLLKPGVACQTDLSTSAQDPSYLVSVDWKPSEDILVYAKTASSFRGGGINARGNAGNVASYAPFKPEKTTDYEVGLKGEFFQRRLRVNSAAYLTSYKDIQKSTIDVVNGVLVTRINNAAKATIKGLEAELTARPIDPLTLRASGSWTDAKYDRFIEGNGNDRTAEPFPVPEYQFNLSATYVAPTSLGDLTLFASYKWQDTVVYRPEALFDASVTQPSFDMIDARVSLKVDALGGTEVALFAKNITNNTYFTGFLPFDNSFGYNIGFVGDPRTYGLEIRKTFGGE